MVANIDYQRYSLNKRAAVGGDLAGCIAHLYTNSFVPTPFSQIGDFTEANFDGYAPSSALVWNAAVNRPTGDFAEMASLPATWIAADASVSQSIVGVYLTTPAGSSPLGVHLLGSFAFLTPVSISHTGDGVAGIIVIGYDGSITVNLS